VAIWQVIVDEHGSLVWRLANRLLGNMHDAADCYQMVFVEAFEASQRRSIENWPGFLTCLVTRRATDLLRVRYRGRNLVEAGPVRQQLQSPAADSPPRIAQGRESIERLHEALTRLPADQAQVFCLRYFEQMSNKEIAALLTTNANRVGVLLHRARDFLREVIDGLPTRDS
jgi:RNA polymerase sigma-70 factor (ECF subfamily)